MKVNNDILRFIHEFNNEFMMRTDKLFFGVYYFFCNLGSAVVWR